MPEITELSAKQRRAALATLSRERLAHISEHYELDVGDRRVAGNHLDAIVRARRVNFAEVLALLGRDELKSICEALGIDASGREKQMLIERILGNGAVANVNVNGKAAARESSKPNGGGRVRNFVCGVKWAT